MASYRSVADAFEWHLALPPAGVRALLTAVCVDQTDEKHAQSTWGHLLWGPKSWTIRCNNQQFQILPLGRDRGFHAIFAPQLLKLADDKSGTRVTMEYSASSTKRRLISVVMGVAAAAFALVVATMVTASFPSHWTWLAWSLRVAAPLWFGIGFSWFLPRATRNAPLEFLDGLFAEYQVTTNGNQQAVV